MNITGMPEPTTLVALILAFGVAPLVAMTVQQTPPNMVLNDIAIILSVYIMAPVGIEVPDAPRQRP